MIKVILTDIEGTTTDIHFVHQVLFPYSRERIPAFLRSAADDPKILAEINHVRTLMGNAHATLEQVTQQLIQWIDEDKKIAPLKALQGYIWLKGYQDQHFESHIYPDVFENLNKWRASGIQLFVYSSGSVQAQQLLFQYTPFGDLRPLFSGYFDTQVGGKKERASYHHIIQQIGCKPDEILFLSDVVGELDAARANGMNTILMVRGNQSIGANQHQVCHTFDDIEL